MQAGRDDRSLGELFTELAQETSTLVRQEVALARAELGQKTGEVGRQIASLVIGGAVAYAGFLAIVAAVIVALADAGLPWWLSALLVGVVVVGVGYALVARARTALQQANLAPQQTVKTLKEDREWAKEQVG